MQLTGDRVVLVTGATGMIGSALVEALVAGGARVRAQVRDRARARELFAGFLAGGNLELREVDFNAVSGTQLADLVAGATDVVHAAALVHRPEAEFKEYELTNIRATQSLAEAAAGAGVTTFVFLSSMAVYGPGPYTDITEEFKPEPVTPYAVSKLASEKWLTNFAGFATTVILRPPLVFGEGDRGNLLKLMETVRDGKYFHIGRADALKSLIYKDDLAHAVVLCLTALGNGLHVYNVANPEPVALRDLTEAIAAAVGRRRRPLCLPEGLVRLSAWLGERLLGKRSPLTIDRLDKLITANAFCVKRFCRDTGFAPRVALAEALRREAAWAAIGSGRQSG